MGALTSKPYAFTARPWELQTIESIDVLGFLDSNICIEVRGNEIMRILPRINYSYNLEWLSDRVRFVFDANNLLRESRIKLLDFFCNFSFLYLSWRLVFQLLRYFFLYKSISNTV